MSVRFEVWLAFLQWVEIRTVVICCPPDIFIPWYVQWSVAVMITCCLIQISEWMNEWMNELLQSHCVFVKCGKTVICWVISCSDDYLLPDTNMNEWITTVSLCVCLSVSVFISCMVSCCIKADACFDICRDLNAVRLKRVGVSLIRQTSWLVSVNIYELLPRDCANRRRHHALHTAALNLSDLQLIEKTFSLHAVTTCIDF